MRKYILGPVLHVAAWPAHPSSDRAADTAGLDVRGKELNRLLAEEWE